MKMKLFPILCLCFVAMSVFGCSNTGRNDFRMIQDILTLAKQDKVAGRLNVHLNGKMEAGFSEGVYFGSPGSVIDAELTFKMKNVGDK